MNQVINLLGVNLRFHSPTEAQKQIKFWLSQVGPLRQVVTVNPDFIITARRNKKFAAILQSADLVTVDGSGIVYAARFLGQPINFSDRLTGVELTERLLTTAEKLHLPVAIVLPSQAYSSPQKIEQTLSARWPNLKVTIYNLSEGSQLTKCDAKIVFVALGAPEQELWIAEHQDWLKTASIALGIGGTFDYLSGTIKRAPRFVRFLGLEWLWRLIRRPLRMMRRIYRSVILFPLLIFCQKICRQPK